MLLMTTEASWEEAGITTQRHAMSSENKTSGRAGGIVASAWDIVKLIFTPRTVLQERLFQDFKAGLEADRIRQEECEAGAEARINASARKAVKDVLAKKRAECAVGVCTL